MEPHEIVEILIKTEWPGCARSLVEATVHLPTRSSRWVATFRDETGRQVWRTTGLREREPALALAKRWEAEAKRRRAAQGPLPRKPIIRVRPGSAEKELGLLSQAEVATIMGISERAVRAIQQRAFDKIRRHPAFRNFYREHAAGEIAETAARASREWALSRAEVAAVYALTRTPVERRALRKLLALVAS